MFSISLGQVANEFQLEKITGCERIEDVRITTSDLNRPGLQLAGFLDYFGPDRIQIIGMVEMMYLLSMPEAERRRRLSDFASYGFPCIIIARNLDILPELEEISQNYRMPLLRTPEITSPFMGALIRYLNVQLAPRTARHGVLVEVYGEGILILGESGVGKSETALEIVKRGHRLIADDVVEIRKVSDKTLLGSAPDIIRHFIEIRGIGILDVKNLYGVGAVKMQETIDLIINLEHWDNSKNYDRLGLEDQYTDIMGIEVPSLIVPVRPGRNLAIIVEVAAMNSRQKQMGYNAAKELNKRLLGKMNNNGN